MSREGNSTGCVHEDVTILPPVFTQAYKQSDTYLKRCVAVFEFHCFHQIRVEACYILRSMSETLLRHPCVCYVCIVICVYVLYESETCRTGCSQVTTFKYSVQPVMSGWFRSLSMQNERFNGEHRV